MVKMSKRKFRFDLSVWVGISAIAVLAVISVMMTLAHFQRQREQAITLFIEKGSALIQTFEAGLRDRKNIAEDTFVLRKLLMETAQQPDIDYMILTDEKGTIIADSDPSMLEQKYGLDLDIKSIAANREIHWRQVANPDGAGTFEVYRSFSPQVRLSPEEGSPAEKSPKLKNHLIIYVGFNMAKIEQAGRADTRNTILFAVILLLVGSLAIVSLFLVQAYRLARTSLSRITVFSDALVRNLPMGLIAFDDRGHVVSCNEIARTVLVVPNRDTLDKEADVIMPAPLNDLLHDLQELGGVLQRDIYLTAADGGKQILEVIAAVFTDDGIPAGKILLLHDVTAIRQLETEVARSRHLNSLGSLAAGVAHEIRNPLSSIKGFALYFKGRLAGNPEDEETADIMIAETERLNRVITQLIEFARPLQLKREKTPMPDLLDHAVKLIAADAQKNKISITVGSPANLPEVDVDPDKVKQVLLNILLNAVASMPVGGDLKIDYLLQKKYLDVIIADTGVGIEKMDLPRIYDPYFTSKPAGTGLGLAVVQKMMEAHSGEVEVESAVGRGTKVILHFPLSGNERMKQ